jgi:hypothetical protein
MENAMATPPGMIASLLCPARALEKHPANIQPEEFPAGSSRVYQRETRDGR